MKNYHSIVSLLISTLRILFGSIFIFSAFAKLTDLYIFEEALISFNLLDNNLVQISIYLIPIIELIIGIGILLNLYTSLFSQLITLMVALFTAVVVAKIFEGAEINCGCFGELTSTNIDSFTVLRNVVLIIIGIFLTVYYESMEQINKSEISFKRISKTLQTVLFVTIFFFLAVQSVIFAIQNRELKSRLALLITDKDVLKEGDTVKAFSIIDLKENLHEIEYRSTTKTLIYIFSTKCSPCTKNLPNWNLLTEKLKETNTGIIGVSLNPIEDIKLYHSENDIQFPTYVPIDETFKLDYKGFLTPQTLLIDENAIVLKSIQGILQESTLSEIIDEI